MTFGITPTLRGTSFEADSGRSVFPSELSKTILNLIDQDLHRRGFWKSAIWRDA